MMRAASVLLAASPLPRALVAARGAASPFGTPPGKVKPSQAPCRPGGLTSPEKGVGHDKASLHSQNDSVTIAHRDTTELTKIAEIARVMGASVGPANAEGR